MQLSAMVSQLFTTDSDVLGMIALFVCGILGYVISKRLSQISTSYKNGSKAKKIVDAFDVTTDTVAAPYAPPQVEAVGASAPTPVETEMPVVIGDAESETPFKTVRQANAGARKRAKRHAARCDSVDSIVSPVSDVSTIAPESPVSQQDDGEAEFVAQEQFEVVEVSTIAPVEPENPASQQDHGEAELVAQEHPAVNAAAIDCVTEPSSNIDSRTVKIMAKKADRKLRKQQERSAEAEAEAVAQSEDQATPEEQDNRVVNEVEPVIEDVTQKDIHESTVANQIEPVTQEAPEDAVADVAEDVMEKADSVQDAQEKMLESPLPSSTAAKLSWRSIVAGDAHTTYSSDEDVVTTAGDQDSEAVLEDSQCDECPFSEEFECQADCTPWGEPLPQQDGWMMPFEDLQLAIKAQANIDEIMDCTFFTDELAYCEDSSVMQPVFSCVVAEPRQTVEEDDAGIERCIGDVGDMATPTNQMQNLLEKATKALTYQGCREALTGESAEAAVIADPVAFTNGQCMFQPVMGEDGQQWYTDGEQLFAAVCVKVKNDEVRECGGKCVDVTPQQQYAEMSFEESYMQFEACDTAFAGDFSTKMHFETQEEIDEDEAWNTCWDFAPRVWCS